MAGPAIVTVTPGSVYNNNNTTLTDVKAVDANNYWVDADGDNNKDDNELTLTKAELDALTSEINNTAVTQTLEDLIKSILGTASELADSQATESGMKDIKAKLEILGKKLADAEKIIAELSKKTPAPTADSEEGKALAEAQKVKAAITKEKDEIMGKLSSGQTKITDQAAKKIYQELMHKYAGAAEPTSDDQTTAKFAMNSDPKAANGAPQAAAGAPGFSYRFGGNASPAGYSGLNMDNYLNSIYYDQAILEGQDSLGKNAAEQKKMMMLFFYFARMAMSGDMGAMYRFMQFITWIISKDKANQNIQMATKLIELEKESRDALQALIDTPAPDAGDNQGQIEFQKIMETTKQEQSSVATSQKLIAQMMEDMAQVVESLMGSTKAALESNGRIMSRLTRG